MACNPGLDIEMVIFDMDGVLIDVSKSYREAIKRTVALYLKGTLGLEGDESSLVSDEDIVGFKEIGGLNNDWDVTAGLLCYFVSLVEGEGPRDVPKVSSLDEVVSFLGMNRDRIRGGLREIAEKKDIPRFQRRARSWGMGLEAVKKAVGSRRTGLIFGTGDLRVDNVVKRIFQEVYLGPHFGTIHGVPPRFYSGRGLFESERLMVKKESLSMLSKRVKMGIASGRPRAEAILGLTNFGIDRYFRSLVTLEDCEAEQERILASEGKRVDVSKPHPFSIIRAVHQLSRRKVRCAYVGDLHDDIEAANRAKEEIDIISVGCLGPYRDKERVRKRFLQTGADLIIDGVDELVSLID